LDLLALGYLQQRLGFVPPVFYALRSEEYRPLERLRGFLVPMHGKQDYPLHGPSDGVVLVEDGGPLAGLVRLAPQGVVVSACQCNQRLAPGHINLRVVRTKALRSRGGYQRVLVPGQLPEQSRLVVNHVSKLSGAMLTILS